MLYYIQYNIGRAKYTISSWNGKDTHKDGSPFYGIDIFKNKKKFQAKERELIKQGYKYKS